MSGLQDRLITPLNDCGDAFWQFGADMFVQNDSLAADFYVDAHSFVSVAGFGIMHDVRSRSAKYGSDKS